MARRQAKTAARHGIGSGGLPHLAWRHAARRGTQRATRRLRCQIDDLDDRMVSMRAMFLERLAGCPIGGRH
jgi:hypothetical protein